MNIFDQGKESEFKDNIKTLFQCISTLQNEKEEVKKSEDFNEEIDLEFK